VAVSIRTQRRIALILAAASLACAPAPRMGETVRILEESAIIVWDAGSKTQHFIRRASFQTEAKDFGFLVPTPGVPALAAADDQAFQFLSEVTAPQSAVRVGIGSRSSMVTAAPTSVVTVLATAKVAGYDATTLEASDALALGNWLHQHGYHSSPELVDWFKPYLERKWKITAFKIDRDAQSGNRADSGAVRMSFQTEAPYFPYREPMSQSAAAGQSASRTLRVFFLGDARVEGTLGSSGSWPAQTVWSDKMDDNARRKLFGYAKLPGTAARDAIWLTEFEDTSSPRPGSDDVYFRKSDAQASVHRPERITYLDPWDILVLGGMAALLLGILYLIYRIGRHLIRSH
jgi:hypothetical protein